MTFFMGFLYGTIAAIFFAGAGHGPVLAVEPSVVLTAEEIPYADSIPHYNQVKIQNKYGTGIPKSVPVNQNGEAIYDYIIKSFPGKAMTAIKENGANHAEFYYFTEGNTTFYAQIIPQEAMNDMTIYGENKKRKVLYDDLNNFIAKNKESYISEIRDVVGDQECLKNTVTMIPSQGLELKKQLGIEPKNTPFGPRFLWSGLCTDEDGKVYKVVKLVEKFKSESDAAPKVQ